MFTKYVASSLLLGILLGGCSNAADQPAAAAASATPAPARSIGLAAGTVHLGRTVQGVAVEVAGASGVGLKGAVTGPGGQFALPGGVTEGRVIARIPGGPVLSAEVPAGQRRGWLWVGPVTTMISRYRVLHPEVSLQDATARVKRYLQIPATVHEGSGLGESHRSPFSWNQFVRAAGSTPLDAFLDQQVALVDSGRTVSFRRPDPYPALHGILAPAAESVAAKGDVVAGDGGAGAFLNAVGGNIVADVATDGISDIVGWTTEALGLNFGTTAQLDTIENQLTQVLAELQTLQSDLNTDFSELTEETQLTTNETQLVTIKGNLQDPITRLNNNCASYLTMLRSASGVPANNTSPNFKKPITSPPAVASQFASSLAAYANAPSNSLADDIGTLRQYLRGLSNQPNFIALYATVLQQQLGNGTPDGGQLFCNIRSNAILQKQQNFLDFYRAYQALALLLTAEASHLDNATYPFGPAQNANVLEGNIRRAIQSLREITADLAIEQQQSPQPTLASDDVVVLVGPGLSVDGVAEQATMWYTNMFYDTFYADVSFEDYTNSAFAGYTNYDVANFSLGPWGAGSWRLPTQAELQRLRSYALAAGSNPVLGLEALGFDLGNAGSNNGFTDISFLCSDSGNVATPVPSTVTCQFTQLPGSPQTPVLRSLLVTPNNRIFTTTTGFPASASAFMFVTGFYSDGSVQDLSSSASWSVTTAGINGAAPLRQRELCWTNW